MVLNLYSGRCGSNERCMNFKVNLSCCNGETLFDYGTLCARTGIKMLSLCISDLFFEYILARSIVNKPASLRKLVLISG